MALVYGRFYCKLKAGDAAASEMAKVDTGDDAHDAFAWYSAIFAAAGIAAGADTLRHVFVLLIGLGICESSGCYCEGRDRSASNITAGNRRGMAVSDELQCQDREPPVANSVHSILRQPVGFRRGLQRRRPLFAPRSRKLRRRIGHGFQRLSKACPALAAEFAAIGLRCLRKHWGPINRRKAEVRPECDDMLSVVQTAVDALPEV
jgi:hypothetical protein